MQRSAQFYLEKTSSKLIQLIIPAGLLILLSGMFWLPDRSDYHRAYYLTLALPTLLLIIIAPKKIPKLAINGIFLGFIAFASYCILSLAWTETNNSISSTIKRPLYICLLFFSTAAIATQNEQILLKTLKASIAISATSALISIIYFISNDNSSRLPGYNSLYNPLLTSHVYGMFAAMCLSLLTTPQRKQVLFALLALSNITPLLLLTGSRTPLLGLIATCTWLVLLQRNRYAYWLTAITTLACTLLFLLNPESITNRGLSYRPEIWQEAWQQIMTKPWLGHGYDHPMIFQINGFDHAFADPHNIELAVLFSGGFIGLGLWLSLYATALIFALRNHQNPLVIISSSALIYGFAAGLTEGNSFMSRPKEHWFLIWIPFSLLAAAWASKRAKNNAETN